MPARLLEDPIPINFTIVGTAEWLRASIPPEDKNNYGYFVVSQPSDLQPILDYLRQYRYRVQFTYTDAQNKEHTEDFYLKALAWDTETTGDPTREKDGLHPHSKTSRLVLFQIGTAEHVYLVQPDLVSYFKELMEDETILHLAQNQLFDFKYLLEKYGVHAVRMWCTMLAEQVLTAGRRGLQANLKAIVRRHPPRVTISKETRDAFTTFDGVLTEAILYYSARDVKLLFDVLTSQIKWLMKDNLIQVALLEFDCIPVTAEMELTGLVIVPDILQKTLAYNQGEADRVSAEIHNIYNSTLRGRGVTSGGLFNEGYQDRVINLGSTKEKLAALHDLGLNVASTDSELLEQLDHPIGPLIAEWMGYDKILSTYGERLLKMIHPDTRRFHPRFSQMGEGESSEADKTQNGNSEKGTTATGRYSSNAQQFPKEKKVYANIKDPVLAHAIRDHFAKAA